MERITVSGNRLVDESGRHIILSGINLVFKGKRIVDGQKTSQRREKNDDDSSPRLEKNDDDSSPRLEKSDDDSLLHPEESDHGQFARSDMIYIAPWTAADFAHFRAWGFNVVRLGLIWDAVEPQPGVYDETYLDWIGSMLDLCEQYGLYAFLDMHQDLYSVLYSDGAPEWATLTDGLPHVAGDLWSDAYLESEAVQRAFDHFWSNTAAVDGFGLQDHYIRMWVHVATRFASHQALLGYDFLNEPYPGSSGRVIFANLLSTFAELISCKGGPVMTLEEMLAVFSDPERKLQALNDLEDRTFYESLAKAVEPLVAEFDLGDLDSFYRRITGAVRAIDRDGIIFRENSYFSNMGMECQAQPILDESGQRIEKQIYSPHGYDLVVDSEAIVLASDRRVDVIFDAHRRTQERMQVPVLVGEWGAHGWYAEGLDHIAHLLSLFERNLWNQTYWCYESGFCQAPVLQMLRRPFPQAVCGHLVAYGFNRQTGEFLMTWDEKGCASADEASRIYLPHKPVQVAADGPYRLVELAGVELAGSEGQHESSDHLSVNPLTGGCLLLITPLNSSDAVESASFRRRQLAVQLV